MTDKKKLSLDFKNPNNWPSKIILYTVAMTKDISYQNLMNQETFTLTEENNNVFITGPIKKFDDCCGLLHDWLKKQAEEHLTPWMDKLSKQYQMPYQKLSFRGQKSLWGSCSANQDISLNYKLLFLPARLVRYVLIHELCHTKVMGHSKDFWIEVDRYEPDYRRLRKELKHTDQYLPSWVSKFL